MEKLLKVSQRFEVTSGKGFFELNGSTDGSVSKVASSESFDSRRTMVTSFLSGISSVEHRVESEAPEYSHIR